ncbi:ATP-binding protein [Yinghuangia aomiensis]
MPVPVPAGTTPPGTCRPTSPRCARTPGSREPAARHAAPLPPLVGRDAQLAALHGALDDAAAARGGVVIVSGEPGIGKAHLVAEFARRATAEAPARLWGPLPRSRSRAGVLAVDRGTARGSVVGPGKVRSGRRCSVVRPAAGVSASTWIRRRHRCACTRRPPAACLPSPESSRWSWCWRTCTGRTPRPCTSCNTPPEPLAHAGAAARRDAARHRAAREHRAGRVPGRRGPHPPGAAAPPGLRRPAGADRPGRSSAASSAPTSTTRRPAAVYRRVAGNPFFTRELARLMTGRTAAAPNRTADAPPAAPHPTRTAPARAGNRGRSRRAPGGRSRTASATSSADGSPAAHGGPNRPPGRRGIRP